MSAGKCTRCSSISENGLKIFIALFVLVSVMLIIIRSNFMTIKKMILALCLGKMKLAYIGNSFDRLGLASVYIKILMFYVSLLFPLQDQWIESAFIINSAVFLNPLQSKYLSLTCFLEELPIKNTGMLLLGIYLILPIFILSIVFVFSLIKKPIKKAYKFIA